MAMVKRKPNEGDEMKVNNLWTKIHPWWFLSCFINLYTVFYLCVKNNFNFTKNESNQFIFPKKNK